MLICKSVQRVEQQEARHSSDFWFDDMCDKDFFCFMTWFMCNLFYEILVHELDSITLPNVIPIEVDVLIISNFSNLLFPLTFLSLICWDISEVFHANYALTS